jgi:MFS family permease
VKPGCDRPGAGESRGGMRPLRLAASLGASLAETTATASLYYLLYGGMQPVWGMLSGRLGRVRLTSSLAWYSSCL